MKDDCIKAITRAAGRVLSAAEIKGIEARVLGNMRQLARQDREAWAGMSEAQRMQQAAKMASDQMVAEAVRKKEALIKNAQVIDNVTKFAESQKLKLDGVLAVLVPPRGIKGGRSNVETTAKAVNADLTRNLQSLLNVSSKWAGLFQDKAGVEALIRELHGEDTGVAEAKHAAKAWQTAAEAGRQQFNAEGGNIGRLEDYSMPNFHDPRLLFKAGMDTWVNETLGKLNRDKYVNEDGTLMDDGQLQKFLQNAWQSLVWDGENKAQAGEFRAAAARANSGSAHRQIHFKDADAYMQYQAKFGTNDPLQLLFGHFKRIATDIALVKELGSNPDHMIEYLTKWAADKDRQSGAKPDAVRKSEVEIKGLYDYLAGHGEPVHSEALKRIGDMATGIAVASKLGSATITALGGDQSTTLMAARTVNMPIMQLFRNQLSAMNLSNRAEKTFAMRQGLMHESFTHEVTRWGADNISQTWAGKMGSQIMKLSGLNALTQAEKRAFGIGMYDLAGRLSRDAKTLDELHATDRETLARAGVDEAAFQVWRKAEVVSRNGMTDTVLTPDAIYAIKDSELKGMGSPESLRRDAAQKLIALGITDADVAVPTPGARDKFDMYGGLQRGTWKGEIIRQMGLFKATPYATLKTQFARMMDQDGGANKYIYAAKFLALSALMGAFALQIDQILRGNDPRDFAKNPIRNGFAAILKGGGLGFFGDFLFSDTTLMGKTGALAGATGPSGSTLEALIKLTIGNIAAHGQGKKTHAASDAAELAKSLTPGINLWYAKAVINHLWLRYVQDTLKPGYSARVEQKLQQNFGQQMWWKPHEDLPSRGPDMGKVVGQ